MDIRLTAEYEPSSHFARPAASLPEWRHHPGYVELRAVVGESSLTLVTLLATHSPGEQPGAEEEVVLDTLSAFFSNIDDLLERREKLNRIADRERD